MVKADGRQAVQQNLPGIDPKQLAYEGLKKAYPVPTDHASAERFFRDKCDALIKIRRDNDFLRVVLKDTNVDEEKEKHEYTAELPLDDEDEWTERYVAVAVKAHTAWLNLEAPKHVSK